MNRLTQVDDFGNWLLEGVPWKDLQSGKTITVNTEEKIYEALCKLKDYEESEPDPEQVQQLKERDTAKKLNSCECVSCGNELMWMKDSGTEFCPWCGQRLDWSE